MQFSKLLMTNLVGICFSGCISTRSPEPDCEVKLNKVSVVKRDEFSYILRFDIDAPELPNKGKNVTVERRLGFVALDTDGQELPSLYSHVKWPENIQLQGDGNSSCLDVVLVNDRGTDGVQLWQPRRVYQGYVLENAERFDIKVSHSLLINGDGPFERLVSRRVSFLLTKTHGRGLNCRLIEDSQRGSR
jgi:hypothetical protein